MTERLTIRLPERGEGWKLAKYYRENRDFLQPFYPRFSPDDFDDGAWEPLMPLVKSEFQSRRSVRLCLFQEGLVIGVANLTHVVAGPRYAATLGYSLAERLQGRGLMKEALQAILPEAFTTLNLHRIEANYMPRNERSGRLLTSLGFEKEGLARDYIQIDGRWEDHVLTARLNPNWKG